MKLDINSDNCTAIMTGEETLADVSFAVETIISNFLGRGITKFDCSLSKSNDDCILKFSSLSKKGKFKMVISKVMSFGNAVKNGIFPLKISDDDSFMKEAKSTIIHDGQHRHKSNFKSSTTVVETPDMRPDLLICNLSYGLADMFTGLFALNVNYLKWQGSLAKLQLYIQHDLTDKKIQDYLSSAQDYNPDQKVKTLQS